MKVSELIEKLKEFDQNLEVIIDRYSDCAPVNHIGLVKGCWRGGGAWVEVEYLDGYFEKEGLGKAITFLYLGVGDL